MPHSARMAADLGLPALSRRNVLKCAPIAAVCLAAPAASFPAVELLDERIARLIAELASAISEAKAGGCLVVEDGAVGILAFHAGKNDPAGVRYRRSGGGWI